MGSCVSYFNVSLIVWAKSRDSVHKPQFLKRKESRSGATHDCKSAFYKGSRTHTLQPQSHATQQQIDKMFVECTPCASSGPRHKALLGCGAGAGDASGKDRPVQFCAACGCVVANHSLDNSRRGLLTKWRIARSSPIQNLEIVWNIHLHV